MERINIDIGEKLLYNGVETIIIRIIDINRVCIEEIESNIIHTVDVSSLRPVNSKVMAPENEVLLLPEKDWEKAKFRYSVIKPIIDDNLSVEEIREISNLNGIHISTIYRWISRYNETGTISALAGYKRNGGKGKSRLEVEQDEIIKNKIEKVFLNKNRRSINKVIREIEKECKEKNIKVPHANTIRNRINNISEEQKIRARYGAKKANEMFAPIKSNFPGANFPYSVVQIDHTKVDIILVDEHYRKPIGRPWLTLAIDVYSRMVVGFYLSFDPPGSLGTGLCIANSILPKEIWLDKMNVKGEWPCWGMMKTLHLDNAKEFRGYMLKKACENYDIKLEWRPPGQPNWGGHIERLLGTFSTEIHNLSGTTFSNIMERDKYDSESKASLTLEEFERWLAIYIVNVYHQRNHSSINTSPIKKYKEGILGNKDEKGVGISPRIYDERRLRLDFMPFVERTIQEYGVVIDHIHYYDEVLRKYIHSKEKYSKAKFLFRRDPRDISIVYFYDPELNEYYDIPYRNTNQPSMSIWEYRESIKYLKNLQVDNLTEESIFAAFKTMEEIELSAIKETKKIKRLTRIADQRDSSKIHNDLIIENIDKIDNTDIVDIKPFDDLDDEAFTS